MSRLSEAELSVRLDSLAVASRSLAQQRNFYRQMSIRNNLVQFRARCADDFCIGIVVMTGVMMVMGVGSLDLRKVLVQSFKECFNTQDMNHIHGQRTSAGSHEILDSAIVVDSERRMSYNMISWIFTFLFSSHNVEKLEQFGSGFVGSLICLSNVATMATGNLLLILLLSVVAFRSASITTGSSAFPSFSGPHLHAASNVLPSILPVSTLLIFNGFIGGTIGRTIINVTSKSNRGNVWMAMWLLMMVVHVCTIWMDQSICEAITEHELDECEALRTDDNMEAKEDDGDHRFDSNTRGHYDTNRTFRPLLFHLFLAVFLPACVGAIPFWDLALLSFQ